MAKRLLHYLILAAVLLGVPFLCCWLGGSDEILEGLKQFPASSLFWWFFEYLNRYVWNWYYLGLTGIVFCPDCAYPLLWISPLMVFVLVQIWLKEPCVLDRLKVGSWGLVFRYEIAALRCGLCWETWNYYSYAKWVYAVPWVHAFQVWEMPLIGFAGYLPFGVECAAVTAWLSSAFDRDMV